MAETHQLGWRGQVRSSVGISHNGVARQVFLALVPGSGQTLTFFMDATEAAALGTLLLASSRHHDAEGG